MGRTVKMVEPKEGKNQKMTFFRIAALVSLSTMLLAAGDKQYTIPSGSTVYIEKMPNDLDGYIKAEFVKQKVRLKVVGTSEDAQFIVTGAATEEERRKWHEGWLTAERDKTSGSVSIIDKSSKALIWAGEAGDRSFWWGSMARGGHRKVAARIVSKMKGAVK